MTTNKIDVRAMRHLCVGASVMHRIDRQSSGRPFVSGLRVHFPRRRRSVSHRHAQCL
jgi:hypothetical protein